MTRLALPDATFFALETATRPMHAGALMLFDPPTIPAVSERPSRSEATYFQQFESGKAGH